VARSSKVRFARIVRGNTRQAHHPKIRHSTFSWEGAGIDDLLRHPGTGFGNITLDQQSRRSCGSDSRRVCLGLTEKCRAPPASTAPDIDAQREPRILSRWTILAPTRDGTTDFFDRNEATRVYYPRWHARKGNGEELKKTEASRTALGAAAYRAAHQILDTPIVFADPLAVRILGEHSAAALKRQLDPEEARSWSRLRAFIAARSRFTEEALDEAVRSGTLQFVVLARASICSPIAVPTGRGSPCSRSTIRRPRPSLNVMGHDPAVAMISVLAHPDQRLKDTANNILATKEFVLSLVSESIAEAMNITCIDAPPGTNERTGESENSSLGQGKAATGERQPCRIRMPFPDLTLVWAKSGDNRGSNRSRLCRGSVCSRPHPRVGRYAAIEADWRHAWREVVTRDFPTVLKWNDLLGPSGFAKGRSSRCPCE
jgi:hypothetical protein